MTWWWIGTKSTEGAEGNYGKFGSLLRDQQVILGRTGWYNPVLYFSQSCR